MITEENGGFIITDENGNVIDSGCLHQGKTHYDDEGNIRCSSCDSLIVSVIESVIDGEY